MTTETPRQQRLANGALSTALLFYSAAVLLLPVRLRAVLQARAQPPIYRDYTDFLLFSADLAVLCMLACWAVSLALRPRRLRLGPRSTWMPLAVLTLMAGASAFTSLDALLSVYHAIRLVVLLWFYAFIVNEVRGRMWLWVPVGMQVMLQALIALGQYFGQRSLGLQWLGEPRLDPAVKGVSVVAVDGARLLRAYGLTDHPNILGGCLAFGIILLLPAYLYTRWRGLALAALLPAGAALIITFSRSAWLACGAGLLTMLALDIAGRRRATLGRWAFITAAWALLALPILLTQARFFGVRLNSGNSFTTPSMEQQSIGERRMLIEAALPTIAAHPWLGTGLGTAPQALHLYRPDWPVTFEPPHVALVDSALEIGVPGAAAYLLVSAAPFILFLTHRRGLLADPMACAAIALLLAIGVAGLFDYYTWMLLPGRLWQWLGWGVWALALGAELRLDRETEQRAEGLEAPALA